MADKTYNLDVLTAEDLTKLKGLLPQAEALVTSMKEHPPRNQQEFTDMAARLVELIPKSHEGGNTDRIIAVSPKAGEALIIDPSIDSLVAMAVKPGRGGALESDAQGSEYEILGRKKGIDRGNAEERARLGAMLGIAEYNGDHPPASVQAPSKPLTTPIVPFPKPGMEL